MCQIETCQTFVSGLESKPNQKMVSNSRKKLPSPYVSNYGRIRTKMKKTYTPPPKSDCGYSYFNCFGIVRKVSILVAAAFELTPKSRDEITVEHKNNGYEHRSNNALSNLELLSPAEQVQRSFSRNKSRKSNSSQKSKPILYRKVGEKEWKWISGKPEAVEKLHLSGGNIGMVLNGTRDQTCGYEFKKIVAEDLPGEDWKPVIIDEKESGAFVSNLARFKDTYGVTKTPVPSEGERSRVCINSLPYLFSIVVWTSFNGVSLSSEEGRYGLGDGFEVDHIDGNPLNDVLSNLRRLDKSDNCKHAWADPSSRRAGHRLTQGAVYARIAGSDDVWQRFESGSECERELGVPNKNIARVRDKYYARGKKGRKHLPGKEGKKYEFSSTATGEKEEEEEADLPGEEWRELKKEFFQPFYFKRLAEAMFPSEGADSASDDEEE